MTEGELCALAEKANDLTEIAREALQAVICRERPRCPSSNWNLLRIYGPAARGR